MDEANDAKFVLRCDPIILATPDHFPMPKLFVIILLIFSFTFVFSKKGFYDEKDIPLVMDKLFEYHIEFKQLNDKIVKRTLKVYLEQFDPDKIYLLQKEASVFLDLSDKRAKEIADHITKNDFSDFNALNEIFYTAVHREREERARFKDKINDIILSASTDYDKSSYASTKRQLAIRQKDHFLKFYNIQKKRIKIDTLQRKIKVYDLYNKKMNQFEGDFAFKDKSEMQQHFFTLHFLKAFSKSLDAHTYFFSEDEARDMRVSLEKNFEGIGVVLTETIDGVIVSDMIKNSPAKESKNIEVGDVIVEVNHQNIESLPFDKVLGAMKKRENGQIELGFRRNQKDSIIRVSLTARPIAMDDDRLTYSYEPCDDGIIGKLELKSFYENPDGLSSEKDIKEAIYNLKKIGNLKGLVLDLRENAGGFLSQAIKVAGLFISNGVVVMSKYSNDEVKYLRSLEGSPYYNGPLVILTSKMSASAAEIVAQALQDYGVALVVGDERTFGKGSIQFQTVTNEGADYYYKVTIGRYYTVSGKSTQIDGVKADIVIPSKYASFDIGERYLENALPADSIESAYLDSLNDLEPKLKRLFQRSYTSSLQKIVVYWTRMLPVLRENSKQRLENSSHFKQFLEKQDQIRAKLKGVNVDLSENEAKKEDIQLKEAVNIVQDMIQMETQAKRSLDERFANSKK